MFVSTVIHGPVLEELIEWFEDVAGETSSRAVLVPAGASWGRTTLLDEFTRVVGQRADLIALVIRVDGSTLPDDLALQAHSLKRTFAEASLDNRMAEVLGVDTLAGVMDRILDVAPIVATGLEMRGVDRVPPLAMLLASVGISSAGKLLADSDEGQLAMVRRVASSAARVSQGCPVVVVIDDLDCLDLDLAIALVLTLVDRYDGHVLVVASCDPDSLIARHLLRSAGRFGPEKDRMLAADLNGIQDEEARLALARELLPRMVPDVVERIAFRCASFGEVFKVAGVEAMADLPGSGALPRLNAVIDQALQRPEPTEAEVLVAWAGGAVHVTQFEAMCAAMHCVPEGAALRWFSSVVRLADPARQGALVERETLWSDATRRQLMSILSTTVQVLLSEGADTTDRVGRVVGTRAALRHIDTTSAVIIDQFQWCLITDLEALDDLDGALEVAVAAFERNPSDDFGATVLRLLFVLARKSADSLLVAELSQRALQDGAVVGLEARIWAVITLLQRDGHRAQAIGLLNEVADSLDALLVSGADHDRVRQWRLLMAFYSGRAGVIDMTQRLLNPLLLDHTGPMWREAANQVLYAVGGPGADHRLAIVALEAQLARLPDDGYDDERLRITSALAGHYAALGEYENARRHAEVEVELRTLLQGRSHLATLRARSQFAHWTGGSGNSHQALALYQEVLADLLRVRGPDYPYTLRTRVNIAAWTGKCGNSHQALALLQEVLPDLLRVLGADHPDTVNTRSNIAHWTGQCGNDHQALALFQEVLPDLLRVLGADHPYTLHTRADIDILLSGEDDL